MLRARIESGLVKKRLRDQEVDYLRQVEQLTAAAAEVEAETFDLESLATAAARTDALGQLTCLFQRMAREYHRREQALKQQMQALCLEVDKARQAQQVNKIKRSSTREGER